MHEVIGVNRERIRELKAVEEPSEASSTILMDALRYDPDTYARCTAVKRLFDIFGEDSGCALSSVLIKESLEPRELRGLVLQLFEEDAQLLAGQLDVLAEQFSEIDHEDKIRLLRIIVNADLPSKAISTFCEKFVFEESSSVLRVIATGCLAYHEPIRFQDACIAILKSSARLPKKEAALDGLKLCALNGSRKALQALTGVVAVYGELPIFFLQTCKATEAGVTQARKLVFNTRASRTLAMAAYDAIREVEPSNFSSTVLCAACSSNEALAEKAQDDIESKVSCRDAQSFVHSFLQSGSRFVSPKYCSLKNTAMLCIKRGLMVEHVETLAKLWNKKTQRSITIGLDTLNELLERRPQEASASLRAVFFNSADRFIRVNALEMAVGVTHWRAETVFLHFATQTAKYNHLVRKAINEGSEPVLNDLLDRMRRKGNKEAGTILTELFVRKCLVNN